MVMHSFKKNKLIKERTTPVIPMNNFELVFLDFPIISSLVFLLYKKFILCLVNLSSNVLKSASVKIIYKNNK